MISGKVFAGVRGRAPSYSLRFQSSLTDVGTLVGAFEMHLFGVLIGIGYGFLQGGSHARYTEHTTASGEQIAVIGTLGAGNVQLCGEIFVHRDGESALIGGGIAV